MNEGGRGEGGEGGERKERRKKGEPAKAMTSPRENLITIFTSTRQPYDPLPVAHRLLIRTGSNTGTYSRRLIANT